MKNWLSKKNVRLSLYFFMPVFFASFVIGLGLTIIEAMNRLLPYGAASQNQGVEYLRWYIKTATLGGAIIAVAAGLTAAFALNRPLKRLESALQKIASGRAEELDIGSTNEFASLSKSFNAAVVTIKQDLLDAKTGKWDEAVKGLERMERLAVLGGISAIIAHEIKNPLASVKGLTQLIAEQADNDGDLGKYTSVMLEEIDRLDKVADNLLYLAKPAKSDYKYCDIKLLLDKAVSTAIHATTKKIEILKDPDKTPVGIRMDSDRLERAFLNLLLNAVQASYAGESIRLEVTESPSSVSIKITNKGANIPVEDKGKIFEPFYTTKGKKGTGLGLAVARHVVNAHGGDIKVESSEGETSFIVELPKNA